MPLYHIYEVWTRSRVVRADSPDEALAKSEPEPIEGMSLCNWHVAESETAAVEPPATGGLNYRQIAEEPPAVDVGRLLSLSKVVARCGLPAATEREYETAPCGLEYGHKGDCRP